MLILQSCNYSHYDNFSSLGVENSKLKIRREFFEFLWPNDSNGEVYFREKSWSLHLSEVEKSADSFENAKVRLNYYVRGLYQSTEPPYPGAVSKKELCPKKFLPYFFPDRSNKEIDLFAVSGQGTERNVLGACDEQSAKSIILKIVLHCRKTQRVFELEIQGLYPDFSPTEFNEIFDSFSCKS